ncbi:hypothetical protein H6S82_12525 [Planktothrix sp. FACHB-1355]|uniref:Uncharacterized protein n=1 Tax=Aerosakkonema funiforme FACHB-1375 TaxID=2949571 RepID=A0A926VDU8_9CYAN|nr:MULTISPECIES: hypothetical protein [Oscillatoriales]MBD2181062.1 hypothetical protein [Aerosakkonema funiforme FACHB-1375]MBD3559682.1 hypothetical protein [Planktothrix sp. FACHB-1355]
MTSNTVKDFLETVKPGHSGITCPACGSILGIRRQGTYDMILTKKARLELDSSITNYRSFLEGLEAVLEQINIIGIKSTSVNSSYRKEKADNPFLAEGGVYKNTQGAQAVEEYVSKNIDYFEWGQNFWSFYRRSDFEAVVATNLDANKDKVQKIYNRAKEILLSGLEPRSLSGPLIDLIFEQRYVAQWMKKFYGERASLEALLDEVCPNLLFYLKCILQLDKALNGTPDPNLAEAVLRIQFILALMLGHRSQQNIQVVSLIGIKTNVLFILPRLTYVSPKLLHRLLCSEVVLGNPNLGWDSKFVQAVRQLGINPTTNEAALGSGAVNGNQPDVVARIVEFLGTQIYKFVHFACSGLVGDIPENSTTNNLLNYDWENDKCGWYPKPEETHSVILLGSPGTGKSTVMLTGFTTFYTNAAALGATVSFDSPDDEARMNELNQEYWAGRMPKPNPLGVRRSIKLSVEFPNTSFGKSHFVFTDIPGEVAAQSLTKSGSEPWVLRILKNAETIVFFFDLSIEPSIREKLTKGDQDGTWKGLEDNYNRVNSSRQNAAQVSQLQLLQKLLSDLQDQKGAEHLKTTKFVCVIPKIDLFVNEDDTARFFFTNFYESLKQRRLLVPSRHYRNESFAGLYSLGGTGTQIANSRGIELQKSISKFISDEALKCLGNIGNALEEDEELQPLKTSLVDTIGVRLVATVKHTFSSGDNIYFLPVSAQGEDSKSIELGHPPNQKLSEYVFMLPIALCAEKAVTPQSEGQAANAFNKRTSI